MVRISNWEMLYLTTYIHPEGEEAFVSFDALNDDLSFRIVFENDVDSDKKERDSGTLTTGLDPTSGDRGLMSFRNWSGTDGSSVGPLHVATINDRKVFLIAAAHDVGKAYAVTLQFAAREKGHE